MAEKKKHPVRNTTIGVGLLAALALLFGPRFGLGAGGGVLPVMGQEAPQVQQAQTSEKPETEPEKKPEEQTEEQPDKNLIRIEDGTIYYMNRTVSAEELREELLKNAPEGQVVIEGDKAIKGAYDAVTSLLDELGIKYAG